jgi:hypothetical protein
MLSRNITRCFEKNCLAEKVRLTAWSEEGISRTTILGRHSTSFYRLLAVTRGLPYDLLLWKKTVLQPGNSQKTCFEDSGYNMCKKNRIPLSYYQAGGPPKLNCLSELEPEPNVRIAAPSPFYLPRPDLKKFIEKINVC